LSLESSGLSVTDSEEQTGPKDRQGSVRVYQTIEFDCHFDCMYSAQPDDPNVELFRLGEARGWGGI
jgi:hypothetical protein